MLANQEQVTGYNKKPQIMNSKFATYKHQSISYTEVKAVKEILKSSWLTQGPKVKAFEESLTRFCGSKYAIAVSSGTAALHLACLAIGLQKGDEIITSANTFVASANCGVYCGAFPVLIDIEAQNYNMDIYKLESYLMKHPLKGMKKRVIIPVHFAGSPPDISAISHLSKKFGCIIIEDAAHSFGASYKNGKKFMRIGNSSHSDMTVFSFHPLKTITTGEGGAILTNSKKLYEKLLSLRTHGIVKNSEKQRIEGSWYYEMKNLGYNYRITDIQSALGCEQIRKTTQFISKRKRIAELYKKHLSRYKSLILPNFPKNIRSSYHLFVIRINRPNATSLRRKVFDYLLKQGIGVQVHYIPVNYHPFYKNNFGYTKNAFPNAAKYYNSAISLPIFPGLKDKVVEKIIKILGNALVKYGLESNVSD